MRKFTATQITRLHAQGWQFMPTGPNEYDWLKFDKAGERIASGGDDTWRKDVEAITGKPL